MDTSSEELKIRSEIRSDAIYCSLESQPFAIPVYQSDRSPHVAVQDLESFSNCLLDDYSSMFFAVENVLTVAIGHNYCDHRIFLSSASLK